MRQIQTEPRHKLSSILAPLAFGLLLALTKPTSVHAQGCNQCRETLGQTPERSQSAYRRAIALMTAAGSTVFLASIFALKRFR